MGGPSDEPDLGMAGFVYGGTEGRDGEGEGAATTRCRALLETVGGCRFYIAPQIPRFRDT